MSMAPTHIALHVRNRETSKAFYEEWAGMVDASPAASIKSPWLSSPGMEGKFALVLVPTAQEAHQQSLIDVTRLGFAVESLTVLKTLYAKAVNEDRVERPYEENAAATRASFRMKDPDGFVVEFWLSRNPPLSRCFNNLSLHVCNMNESLVFYQNWCGMDLLHTGQVSRSCRVGIRAEDNPFQIVLCDGAARPSAQSPREVTHIGIAVETDDELTRHYERAKAAGLLFFSDMRVMPYPAGKLFIIRDPNGRNVEFSVGQPFSRFNTQAPEVRP